MRQLSKFRGLGRGSRGKRRRRPLTAGILILVLVAQFGCASSGTDKRSASTLLLPLPPEAFQGLGTVAVTSGRFAPTFDIVDDPSRNTPQTSGCNINRPETFGCLLKGALITELYFFLFLPTLAVVLPVVLIKET